MRNFLKLYSLPLIIVLIGLSAYFIAYIVFIVLAENENFDLPPQMTNMQTFFSIESNDKEQPISQNATNAHSLDSIKSTQSPSVPQISQSSTDESDSTHSPQSPTNALTPLTKRFVIARSNVRNAPAKNATIITKAKEGESITLLEDLGQWSKIRTESNIEGYIASYLLKENLSETYRIIVTQLNVRAKANEKSAIIMRLNQNTIVEVLGVENVKWAKITLPNRQQGFVSLDFLVKE